MGAVPRCAERRSRGQGLDPVAHVPPMVITPGSAAGRCGSAFLDGGR
ncbi:hypothetical protein ACFPM0_19815 [Pseudonocardia sulfidoxydans]